MTMVLLAYISSGMYATVENIKRGKDSDTYLQFHDSVYFVIVSLATVGYGDEIPTTEFGRVIVLFIIIFTIVLIPAQTNELLRLIQIRSRYRRIEYKSVDVRHIVVTGSVDPEALSNFCNELFHQDHGSQATNAVIIQDHDPNSEMEIFFQENKLSLTYLAGDIFEDQDLDRSLLHRAESCVVLTNKNSQNSLDEDYRNILTALSLKKFVYNMNKHFQDEAKYNIKLCIQLIKPESKMLYFKSLNLDPTHDQLIMVEEIKMNLLAKSCFAPGLISCMSNLFASAGGIEIQTFSREWMKEYATGMGHEIYRVLIQENEFFSPTPLTFKKIAEICFTEYAAVIFALEIEIKGQTRSIVRLNPSNFEFMDWANFNYYLYIICEDESLASQVQKLEMSDDKYEKYVGRQRTEKLNKELFYKSDNILGTNGNLLDKGDDYDSLEEDEPKVETKLGTQMTLQKRNSMIIKNHAAIDKNKETQQLIQSRRSIRTNMLGSGMVNLNGTGTAFNKSPGAPGVAGAPPATEESLAQLLLEKDYDILPKPKTQTEVIIKDGNIKLSNHIVVCGLHSSIYHFILPLRAKYLKSYQQDIVIISPLIKKDIWESISRFPRVFLVEGSALQHETLRQAYIHKADKAVIMGHDSSIASDKIGGGNEINDEMIDAKSIFIYKGRDTFILIYQDFDI